MPNLVKGGLYVVRRPFKAHGILHDVGEVIEDPTSIKLFRSRLSDRDIIELFPDNELENLTWLEYLESRATGPIDARVYEYAGEKPPIVNEDGKEDADKKEATPPPTTPPADPGKETPPEGTATK